MNQILFLQLPLLTVAVHVPILVRLMAVVAIIERLLGNRLASPPASLALAHEPALWVWVLHWRLHRVCTVLSLGWGHTPSSRSATP